MPEGNQSRNFLRRHPVLSGGAVALGLLLATDTVSFNMPHVPNPFEGAEVSMPDGLVDAAPPEAVAGPPQGYETIEEFTLICLARTKAYVPSVAKAEGKGGTPGDGIRDALVPVEFDQCSKLDEMKGKITVEHAADGTVKKVSAEVPGVTVHAPRVKMFDMANVIDTNSKMTQEELAASEAKAKATLEEGKDLKFDDNFKCDGPWIADICSDKVAAAYLMSFVSAQLSMSISDIPKEIYTNTNNRLVSYVSKEILETRFPNVPQEIKVTYQGMRENETPNEYVKRKMDELLSNDKDLFAMIAKRKTTLSDGSIAYSPDYSVITNKDGSQSLTVNMIGGLKATVNLSKIKVVDESTIYFKSNDVPTTTTPANTSTTTSTTIRPTTTMKR